MCWGCVESGRITREVFLAIDAFRRRWPDSEFGPAHIVISDENVGDDNLQWCLDHWDEYAGSPAEREARAEEYAATKDFLRTLMQWPEEKRVGPAELEEE